MIRRSALCAWVLLAACDREGDPQAQLLVVIDTDAPVVGQLLQDPALSADAAIDTVRVDAIAADGSIYDQRELVAPEVLDWPLSLGVASRTPPAVVRLRIRAFRGVFAAPDSIGGVLEPLREVTIDRLVDVALPNEEVVTARVLLSLDCMGESASFVDPPTTCIDALQREAPSTTGLELIESVPTETRAGSSLTAREAPCVGANPTGDAVCIPGGFTVLGDRSLVGIADLLVYDPYPLMPVRVSPFWLDRIELTVGRLRPVFAQLTGTPPTEQTLGDPLYDDCSWRGAGDDSHDARALTCTTADTAAEICALFGGRLPSEAEWEHAARGRGQQRRYPWGDELAQCCMASAARSVGPCSGLGPEPVESHPPSEECGGIGDVSRDGVVDLGGSVMEYVRDDFAAYGQSCWSAGGVAHDPVCVEPPGGRAARGGAWDSPLSQTTPALRKLGVHGPGQGLRCAYPDGGG